MIIGLPKIFSAAAEIDRVQISTEPPGAMDMYIVIGRSGNSALASAGKNEAMSIKKQADQKQTARSLLSQCLFMICLLLRRRVCLKSACRACPVTAYLQFVDLA
jgi:hypothetical protein